MKGIKGNGLKPGDCISIDQYQSSHKGRLATGFGKTATHMTYGGGTIFVERLLYNHGVLVKSYRADNGVFSSTDFEDEIKKGSQSISYSGVGAQHQNGVAERAIRTVVERARTMLIHAAIRNPEFVEVSLWPFALSHSCHVWNSVPKLRGFSPLELLSCSVSERNNNDLRHLHTWGCPVYILEYDVAVGKKIPKWSPRD